jgi:hypothetical protein
MVSIKTKRTADNSDLKLSIKDDKIRSITNTKTFKSIFALSFIGLCYLILFLTYSENDAFSFAGGFVGGVSSVSAFYLFVTERG